MTIRNLWVLGVCVCLSACATTKWPWEDGSARSQGYPVCGAECGALDAQKALSAASHYCVRIMDSHDNSRAMLGGSKVALSTIGALSGGVIAQVTEGTAAKAWAGVAGVTSGMQSKLDEAFAGALYIQRRRQVALAAHEGMLHVLKADPEDYSDRVDRSMLMALGCSVAAAEVDAKVLDAINRSGDGAGGEQGENRGQSRLPRSGE